MSQAANEIGKQISGEVRIPIDQYHTLLEKASGTVQAEQKFTRALVYIKEWLTSLRSKSWFKEMVEEFNEQNDKIKITLNDQGQVEMNLVESHETENA